MLVRHNAYLNRRRATLLIYINQHLTNPQNDHYFSSFFLVSTKSCRVRLDSHPIARGLTWLRFQKA